MKRHMAIESGENEYYARVSRKLKNTKYLMLLLMVVAAFLTLWAYRDRLTYGNLRYLLRDVDAAGNASFSSDTVYYTADEKNTYIYFRDDLAVGSSDGITFHRAFGSRSFSDNVNFKAPILAGSDKYMIAYDSGGYSFYVYNSLGRVYDEKLDTEIISAAAADNGNFAILTKNHMGGADIIVYDKNFKKTATLTRADDAYTIGFLSDGRIYMCESAVTDAALCTDVSFYSVGDSDTHGDMRESGLVLRLGSLKKGYYVLTDRSLSFFTSDGERTAFYSFGTADILYADAAKDSVSILLKENASGEELGAYTYCADCKSESYSVQKGAKGMAVCGGRICVLYDGAIKVLGGDTDNIEIPVGARKILSVGSDSVIVCYNDYAKIFSVK